MFGKSSDPAKRLENREKSSVEYANDVLNRLNVMNPVERTQFVDHFLSALHSHPSAEEHLDAFCRFLVQNIPIFPVSNPLPETQSGIRNALRTIVGHVPFIKEHFSEKERAPGNSMNMQLFDFDAYYNRWAEEREMEVQKRTSIPHIFRESPRAYVYQKDASDPLALSEIMTIDTLEYGQGFECHNETHRFTVSGEVVSFEPVGNKTAFVTVKMGHNETRIWLRVISATTHFIS